MIGPVAVGDVFARLAREPRALLWDRWNWKSAVCSSVVRAGLFFAVNASAGLPAAQAAACTELVYRGVVSGFHGAATQAFRHATPRWLAVVSTLCLMPLAGHALECVVHWARGTANLGASLLASMCLSLVSTLFNLYAMQRGALIVADHEASSLATDLRRMPRLVGGFVSLPFRLLLSR